jgi:hypothetical protein
MSDPSKLDDLLVRLDADLLYQFAERAGIMEYDGGVARDEAELLALVDLLRSHPGALLGLRALRFDLAGRSVYILASDIDVAYDRVKPLSAQARVHDVDDLSAVLREQFGGMAVLLSLP